MLTLFTLRKFINATAILSGFKSAEFNFVSAINDGDIDWDHLNYFVESFKRLDVDGEYMKFRIVFHAFARDLNDAGETQSREEKAETWQKLGEKFDEFNEALRALSKNRIVLINEPEKKPDEDRIGTADLIYLWIEGAEYKVLTCKNATPTPIPETPEE